MKCLRKLFFVCSFLLLSGLVFAQPEPVNISLSDQRAGSVLVFPYYTSKLGSTPANDTRMVITNTGTSSKVVHLFMIEGRTCEQADYFLCFNANQSCDFLASDLDPYVVGYAIAVVIDPATGGPIRSNVLIGTAFVQMPGKDLDNSMSTDVVAGGYNAESFYANSDPDPPVNDVATLKFDGVVYDKVGRWLTTQIQAPVDAPRQTIVTVGLSGSIVEQDIVGAGQTGIGLVYNEIEKMASFSNFLQGTCQAIATITDSSPRVIYRLNRFMGGAGGNIGMMKVPVFAGVGLIIVPQNSRSWAGIRPLYKHTNNPAVGLEMPVIIPPGC